MNHPPDDEQLQSPTNPSHGWSEPATSSYFPSQWGGQKCSSHTQGLRSGWPRLQEGPLESGWTFFWSHFLVRRLLWVTIACLSFIHMCTMRQNLGEYHIKIDLSRRFFERYTKEGNFISGCSKFPGGLMRMEDWGQKFYSCCRFPIIYIKKKTIYNLKWPRTVFLSASEPGGIRQRDRNGALNLPSIRTLDILRLLQRGRCC